MPPPDSSFFGPEQFADLANVSRETLARLKLYAALLEEWNTRHNLVSKNSLAGLWRRHFWDSAQLLPFIPEGAMSLIDLGSGAGFPGLVLAELLRERRDFRVVLTESVGKKCRFLAEVSERLGLKTEIRQGRIEDQKKERFDIVTARAFQPLPGLLAYAQRFWGTGSVGLFLKGQNVEAELTESRKSWRMNLQPHPSRSDPSGVILEVRELKGVEPERGQGRRKS